MYRKCARGYEPESRRQSGHRGCGSALAIYDESQAPGSGSGTPGQDLAVDCCR